MSLQREENLDTNSCTGRRPRDERQRLGHACTGQGQLRAASRCQSSERWALNAPEGAPVTPRDLTFHCFKPPRLWYSVIDSPRKRTQRYRWASENSLSPEQTEPLSVECVQRKTRPGSSLVTSCRTSQRLRNWEHHTFQMGRDEKRLQAWKH